MALRRGVIKGAVFAAAFVPAGWLGYQAWQGDLTANPIEYITHYTGDWTLALLMASLAITPVRRLTGWREAIRLRRMLGLFAFFYATLHLCTWAVLDKFFDWPVMFEDIVTRRFITVGMFGYGILLLLAITSSAWAIRRMGRRWQMLHRWVYVAAVAGVIHFWWLVKADITLPRRWAIVLAALLGIRIWWAVRRRIAARQRPAAHAA